MESQRREAGIENLHFVFLGAGMLCVAFVMRRTSLRVKGRLPRKRADAVNESLVASAQANSHLRNLELRLYDFGREVEGRMETRLAVLDELISEADREIGELRGALSDEPDDAAANHPRSSLTREQAHMADCLYGAGFQVLEIASAMKCNPHDVAEALSVDPPEDISDAA